MCQLYANEYASKKVIMIVENGKICQIRIILNPNSFCSTCLSWCSWAKESLFANHIFLIQLEGSLFKARPWFFILNLTILLNLVPDFFFNWRGVFIVKWFNLLYTQDYVSLINLYNFILFLLINDYFFL